MSHSFLEFRSRTKLMRDLDLIVVTHTMLDVALNADPRIELTPRVVQLFECWNMMLDPYPAGCLDLQLDEFVRTDGDILCFVHVLETARGRIRDFGSIIPASFFENIIHAPGLFVFADRSTADVLIAFEKFEFLIKGTK